MRSVEEDATDETSTLGIENDTKETMMTKNKYSKPSKVSAAKSVAPSKPVTASSKRLRSASEPCSSPSKRDLEETLRHDHQEGGSEHTVAQVQSAIPGVPTTPLESFDETGIDFAGAYRRIEQNLRELQSRLGHAADLINAAGLDESPEADTLALTVQLLQFESQRIPKQLRLQADAAVYWLPHWLFDPEVGEYLRSVVSRGWAISEDNKQSLTNKE